jgi:type IV pilus assembly protein PilY1
MRRHSVQAVYPPRSGRLGAFVSAFLATLMALPASAGIAVPTEPLTTTARVPPNILFILDDSGSMQNDYMPDALPTANNFQKQFAYTRNSIWYNPAVEYRPWVDSTGAEMTGGISYNAVYTSKDLASGNTIDLGAGTTQGNNPANWTFYVPKDTSNITEAYLREGINYYRYQILTTSLEIYRSEWQDYTAANTPANALAIGCSDTTSGFQWRNCTRALPNAGRTEEQERTNFAIWYSYHRTRMKVAKAGSGRAFKEMGRDVRVGFRTINNRGTSGPINHASPIPVSSNSGLFDDPSGTAGANNNRTEWYNRLYSATGSSTTPLRGALTNAGDYFSSDGTGGPYGPESGSDQYACRQNFSILTTDGYWNETNYSDVVGEQDSTAGPTITNPRGASYTYEPAPPYAGKPGDANTLADVAMRYWKSDLRSDLENVVAVSAEDPAFWQHMTTFGISIGAKGTLNPATDLPAITAGTLAWPTPQNNNIVNIDDLWHASINGRGKFIVANDPTEFARGLQDSLETIIGRTGSFSNVSVNAFTLSTTTRLFQARYETNSWTGELAAYAWNAGTKSFSVTPAWTASVPTANRNVFTFSGTAGITFPTSAQESALARTGVANFPVTGPDNAAYITGSQALEKAAGGTLRDRTALIGDIVDSSPVYVAETGTVYVGANDGMLHAFDASDGVEEFAYVPASVNLANLASLSRPDYTHRYFVDGPVVVSTRAQTAGSNILVGTLGRGGKGIFALDVTSPGSFSASDIEWEATETPLGNMGLIISKPIIAKLNNGVTAYITGNGINSTSEHSALLIYNLATGELIKEIDTGTGSTSAPNGMTAPIGRDSDSNGTVDFVYAGDMLGNVWKFDLTGNVNQWDNTNKRKKLFAASNAGLAQPITGGLSFGMDPATFKTWVFFGTGRLVTVGDMTDHSVQTLYGVQDTDTTVAKTSLTQRTMQIVGTSPGGFAVRGFQTNTPLPSGSVGWYVDLVDPPNPPGTAVGERVTSAPQLDANVLVVSSSVPTNSACAPDGRGYLNALDAFTGTSTLVSYFDTDSDGTFTDEVVTGAEGTASSNVVGSINLNIGMLGQGALVSGGNGTGQVCVGGSSGSKKCVDTDDPRIAGRVSWREVRRD